MSKYSELGFVVKSRVKSEEESNHNGNHDELAFQFLFDRIVVHVEYISRFIFSFYDSKIIASSTGKTKLQLIE